MRSTILMWVTDVKIYFGERHIILLTINMVGRHNGFDASPQ
jgi:hypothetical protein